MYQEILEAEHFHFFHTSSRYSLYLLQKQKDAIPIGASEYFFLFFLLSQLFLAPFFHSRKGGDDKKIKYCNCHLKLK